MIIWATIFVTLSSLDTVLSKEVEKAKELTTSRGKTIFVTPAAIDVPSTTLKPSGTIRRPQRSSVTESVTKRYNYSNKLSSFRTDDSDRQQSVIRQPARLPQDSVLSSSEDFTLTDVEVDDNSGPVSYETIVYDPNSNDSSAAFSRSQIWTTPEITIKDTTQRHEGGRNNVMRESSSRLEYTPENLSAQTPLNQIRYRKQNTYTERNRYTATTSEPFQRPTHQSFRHPPPTQKAFQNNAINKEDGRREESRQQRLQEEDDREELNEEEEEEQAEETEDEKPKKKYPVRLEEQSFNPYEGVGAPEEIYNDVLSNIGSVFDEEDDRVFIDKSNKESQNFEKLAPQFERHSYENLQQAEADDDGEEVEDDGEELVEYEDEADESKHVSSAKEVPQGPPPTLPPRQTWRPFPQPTVQSRRQETDEREELAKSPFPNVKIIRNQNNIDDNYQNKRNRQNLQQSSSTPLPFSPWLPAQRPTVAWQKPEQSQHQPQKQIWQNKKEPWRQSTTRKPWAENPDKPVKNHNTWHQSTPTKSKSSKTAWSKPEASPKQSRHKEKENNEEGEDSKPYQESFSNSYQNSWKTSSPKKNEKSSYSNAWSEDTPVQKYSSQTSNNGAESKENGKTVPKPYHNLGPQGSRKIPRESPPPVTEEVDESSVVTKTSAAETSSRSARLFVTPLPDKDNMATSTRSLNHTAPVVIDSLYAKQSNVV